MKETDFYLVHIYSLAHKVITWTFTYVLYHVTKIDDNNGLTEAHVRLMN